MTERTNPILNQSLLRFTLMQGVLKWGLGTGVLWFLIMAVWNPGGASIANLAFYSLLIFPLAGVVFGVTLWFVFRRFGNREAPE